MNVNEYFAEVYTEGRLETQQIISVSILLTIYGGAGIFLLATDFFGWTGVVGTLLVGCVLTGAAQVVLIQLQASKIQVLSILLGIFLSMLCMIMFQTWHFSNYVKPHI